MSGYPQFLLELLCVIIYAGISIVWIIQSLRVSEGYAKDNGGYILLCAAFVIGSCLAAYQIFWR